MNSLEAEYMEISLRNAWIMAYHLIGEKCKHYKYTTIEAKRLNNEPFNRYRDVYPYDHSRIILRRSEKDYINASLVRMDMANRKYILTQGPLHYTVKDFWLMVWEQNSQAVIMLNRLIEKGEFKCAHYWPDGIGEENKLEFPEVKLEVVQISEEKYDHYTTRVFKIHDLKTNESREVIHFHYTMWPDFGVPESPVAFLQFLKMVRDSGSLDANVGPAVVHCSAGIGRSGTFCLVDSCLVLIENYGVNSISVRDILADMRRDRMGLIQTADQLRFSYLAIIEGIRQLDPSYQPRNETVEENIYAAVVEIEDSPPSPPPRAESLATPPARPLPAIPSSASLGNLNLYPMDEASTSGNTPPEPLVVTPEPIPVLSSDEENDEPVILSVESVNDEDADRLRRRRRDQVIAERVAQMKRKSKDADDSHALKRCKTENTKEEYQH